MYESIQPVVLVGGASRRFGRDKLREPVGDGMLVDRPIGALREVFGPRVLAVGDCEAIVAKRADGHVPDAHPGTGPLGGIIAALAAMDSDVFVLSGDAVGITPEAIRNILASAADQPGALSVLGVTDRVQPCIGLYRIGALVPLRAALAQDSARPLAEAIDPDLRMLVPIAEAAAANVNTPADLASALGKLGPGR